MLNSGVLERVAVAALMVGVIACGEVSNMAGDAGGGDDGGGTEDATGDFTLSVVPVTIDVPIASSRTVTLNVDRTGSTGVIALSAQGVPAGIQVTFEPSTLSAEANASEVTIAVDGGSAAATSSITLVGTAGTLQRTTPLSVTSTTITVAGRIRSGASGVTVRIVGKPATTSDASGNFTFTNVTPPYDLYTVGTTGIVGISTSPTVYYYKGLTRPDPEVRHPTTTFFFGVLTSGATVNGTKSGGDQTSKLAVTWSNGGQQITTGNSYSVPASWPQAATNTGTLYGLQWSTRGNGAPDVFVGYGSSNATLNAGVTSTVNLSLTAPATATLTGTITAPNGFPAPAINLYQKLGNNQLTLWGPTATTAIAATIPVITAGTSSLHAKSSVGANADATSTEWVYPALATTTDVSFALPAPAVLSMPIASASGVTTTTPFQYSTSPMTVNAVNISTSGASKAVYAIYTTDSMVTIPNVPELPLPPNQTYTWSVAGYGPHVDVNDAATTDGLREVSPSEFTPGATPHFFTSSASRTFTAAP